MYPDTEDGGCRSQRNIELLTYTEVEAVEGYIGNFDVTFRKKAASSPLRRQKPADSSAAVVTGGDCEDVCPVIRPNPFGLGMAPMKAIYVYHPQVSPLLYTIDFDSCVSATSALIYAG